MLEQLKIEIVLVLMAISILTSCYLTRDHYLRKIADMQVVAETARNNAQSKQLDLQHNAETQHAKDQMLLLQRDNYLDSLRPSTITYRCAVESSKGTDRASGVADAGVNGYIAISPEARDRIIATYKRCAQLNIDTIKLNASF